MKIVLGLTALAVALLLATAFAWSVLHAKEQRQFTPIVVNNLKPQSAALFSACEVRGECAKEGK